MKGLIRAVIIMFTISATIVFCFVLTCDNSIPIKELQQVDY